MEPRTFAFASATGLGPIHAVEYPVNAPRGVVVVCHGMLEHFGRYDAFARHLAENGFAVFGLDLAGHGKSTANAPRGYFGTGGYEKLVEDVHTLRQKAETAYPGMPVFLMGHSMGSLIARAYCAKYGEGLKGTIWMGNSGVRLMLPVIGIVLTKFAAAQRPSMFFRKLTYSGFYKRYQKPYDVFAWVSSDDEIIKSYNSDLLCIKTFCGKGYNDLSLLTLFVSKQAWFETCPKDLPILLLSGLEDPVGQYGAGVKQIDEILQNEGVKDITVKLYEGARHEVLNDFSRQEVLGDILGWLNKNLR
jgi:alpha-beta hydrolase superfamily lysophospholipase